MFSFSREAQKPVYQLELIVQQGAYTVNMECVKQDRLKELINHLQTLTTLPQPTKLVYVLYEASATTLSEHSRTVMGTDLTVKLYVATSLEAAFSRQLNFFSKYSATAPEARSMTAVSTTPSVIAASIVFQHFLQSCSFNVSTSS